MAAVAHNARKKKMKGRDEMKGRAQKGFEKSAERIAEIVDEVEFDDAERAPLSQLRLALEKAHNGPVSDDKLTLLLQSTTIGDDQKVSFQELEYIVRETVLESVVKSAGNKWRKRARVAAADEQKTADGDSASGGGGSEPPSALVASADEDDVPRTSREKAHAWYSSERVQFGVAFLIFTNFLVNALEAQWVERTSHGGDLYDMFHAFELFYTIIFIFELGVNMFSNVAWEIEFWKSTWNVFDFVVVVVSIISVAIGPDAPQELGELRLLRAFRVFRLFKRIEAMRKILKALNESIPGVVNAFMILLLVHMLYAVLGVQLFRDIAPDDDPTIGTTYFGSFSGAMFTLFSLTMGDNSSAREIVNEAPFASIYFVTFPLLSGVILMNVVIAVLLEKFCEDTEDDENDILEEEKSAYLKENALEPPIERQLSGSANMFASLALAQASPSSGLARDDPAAAKGAASHHGGVLGGKKGAAAQLSAAMAGQLGELLELTRAVHATTGELAARLERVEAAQAAANVKAEDLQLRLDAQLGGLRKRHDAIAEALQPIIRTTTAVTAATRIGAASSSSVAAAHLSGEAPSMELAGVVPDQST